MIRRNRALGAISFAACAIAVLAVGCGRTGRSSEPSIKSVPQRIVSLTPSNTEILFALGLGDKVVGDTAYCDYPPEAKKKPKIGDMNVSIEKVVSLKPDVVVADTVLSDKDIPRLKSLGIPVIETSSTSIADAQSDILLIGEKTGTKKRAEEINKRISAACDNARKAAKSSKKVLVAVSVSPLYVAGPKTFVDDMIRCCNGVNVAGSAKPGFNTFSTETAVKENPDVIIVTRQEDRQTFTTSPVWANTNAVKSGKVVVLDPNTLMRPGPRLADGILAVEKVLQ